MLLGLITAFAVVLAYETIPHVAAVRPAVSQGPATAEIFAPGVISDAQEQWRITFTPDGRTAYFASSAGFFPITRQATIYETHLVQGEWSTPVIAPFSGIYSDIDPFISPDGRQLYFSSIRPVDGATRGDIDIWVVTRTAGGWGPPVHLGPEVNGPADELYPSASADGTLYFASGPPAPQAGLHFDIYRAKPARSGFAPREALGPAINTRPHRVTRGCRLRGNTTLRSARTGRRSCSRRCGRAGSASATST